MEMNSSGRVISIQVGMPATYPRLPASKPKAESQPVADESFTDIQQTWTTGFFKVPCSGQVFAGFHHLEGDGQADLKHHGGRDKAVLAYSADHYRAWEIELQLQDLPYGAFGENLTVAEMTEQDVCVGDVWQVGTAILQVSQPRQPCWKLGQRWTRTELPKRVIQTGRCGWYLRVLQEGNCEAGIIRLLNRLHSGWSILNCNRVFYDKSLQQERHQLAQISELSDAWRADLLPVQNG